MHAKAVAERDERRLSGAKAEPSANGATSLDDIFRAPAQVPDPSLVGDAAVPAFAAGGDGSLAVTPALAFDPSVGTIDFDALLGFDAAAGASSAPSAGPSGADAGAISGDAQINAFLAGVRPRSGARVLTCSAGSLTGQVPLPPLSDRRSSRLSTWPASLRPGTMLAVLQADVATEPRAAVAPAPAALPPAARRRSRASLDLSQFRLPWRSPPPVHAHAHPARRDRQAQQSAQVVCAIVKGKPAAGVQGVEKVKRDLLKPERARRIVGELKQLEADKPRGVCLQCTDEDAMALGSSPSSVVRETVAMIGPVPLPKSPSAASRFRLTMLSPGDVLAGAVQASGALTALADVTTALIAGTAGHDGSIIPPQDRMSVYICTSALSAVGLRSRSKPTVLSLHEQQLTPLRHLGLRDRAAAGLDRHARPRAQRLVLALWLPERASSIHSMRLISQALLLAGGAPELQPFVRYISAYLDLEWTAIRTQNKGQGVVVAATWLIPIALVARPYDFPLPSAPSPSSALPPSFVSPPSLALSPTLSPSV